MVEDHPYTYKDFEGSIPEGNYGAGTVIVWDNGTYILSDEQNTESVEDKFKSGLKNGHLSFILNGKKLKGEFALVKLKIKQKDAWLLIKKDDQYASDTDILKEDKSVISGLTLEGIGK
jgi:bifunctional non-homologous end joining protein LigD